jgi:hypothetical protein
MALHNVGGEGLKHAHELELRPQYFDFPCYKLGGKEFTCKEPDIWDRFRALHLAIRHDDKRDYFMI